MSMSTTYGQTAFIETGIEMYFESQGQGAPLLLLHGFTGSGADWALVFNSAPAGYRLIIPDLRGHGRSTNPSAEFTHRQSARDAFCLLDHLKIERFKAIGMSAGAKTLLHMATQQPSRIDAMVLVSAAPYFPPEARAIMAQMTVDNRTDEEWRVMRQRHYHGDEQIRALWKQAHAFKDSYEDMNFTPPLLSRISARTLIVHGDRDPLYPVRMAMELHAAIARSHLWIVPNGGHGPIFGNQSAPFVETALAFLRGDWQPT
ncbi:MAG: alpha/beta hydrolase [Deltaproteobacteria bacterium]|nr:alpha/beta hydrolase [Deltaproteobacteria bacterium]MBI3390058.1 alpha/beta hydrolase [Deltaproteobacteria bacterium]